MAQTIMYAVVSADGYVATPDGGIGPLFDWLQNGDVVWEWNGGEMRTSQASKDFIQAVYPNDIGAMVVGRFVFDQTNGWDGQAVAGDRVFVVTHEEPKSWEFIDTAPFTFVTDGVESAIAQAREVAGDRIVDVAAGNVGGQALRLGLIDRVVMNVVPVVFGAGRPFFGGADGEVTLADPSLVAQGKRVTHLVYDVAPIR
ncbi:dihydrofolate reductase family protein [Kribbella sp. NPDC002412]